MKKIVVSWIICVLALVALMAWLGRDMLPSHLPQRKTEASMIDGSFKLQAADGRAVTEKNFKGRYMLIYFGYTHCPDVCPTSLLLMQNALEHLGPLADKIQPIFITIDPARDSPKITDDYAKHFGPRMIGLGGTAEQIAAIAEHYKVYYSKIEDSRSALGYTMDHSSFIYLMGPHAEFLDHYAGGEQERDVEAGLRRHVQ